MMDGSFIFSAEIIIPPNFTASDNENFAGDNLRFMRLHNFINLPICSYNSSSVLEKSKKSSMFFKQSNSSSSLTFPSVM